MPVVVAYGFALFAWSALRHAHYGSHAYDLGAYHQVFYQLGAHGRLWSSIEQMHQWSAHLEIGLLPVGILYWIAPTPLWLFALQAAACAATAVPVERFARITTRDSTLALGVALATLLTPQLLFASIDDFHSITLCAFPIALLLLGIETDALVTIAIAAGLALSLREQMGLAVFAASLAWVLRHGRSRAAVAGVLGAVGLGVFLAEVLWLIPSFGDGASFRYIANAYPFGSSPAEAARFALSHPLDFLTMPLQGRRRLVYPVALASGALLPGLAAVATKARRAAVPLLIGAPLLLVQLYSSRVALFSVETQYGAPLVPIAGAVGAIGVSALLERSRKHGVAALAVWALVTAVHAIVAVGPLAFVAGGPLDRSFAGSPRAAALARVSSSIPRGADVSAQDAITPHLTGNVRLWPAAAETSRFVALDTNGPAEPLSADAVRAAAARLRSDPRFDVRVDEAGVLLVERRAAP